MNKTLYRKLVERTKPVRACLARNIILRRYRRGHTGTISVRDGACINFTPDGSSRVFMVLSGEVHCPTLDHYQP